MDDFMAPLAFYLLFLVVSRPCFPNILTKSPQFRLICNSADVGGRLARPPPPGQEQDNGTKTNDWNV